MKEQLFSQDFIGLIEDLGKYFEKVVVEIGAYHLKEGYVIIKIDKLKPIIPTSHIVKGLILEIIRNRGYPYYYRLSDNMYNSEWEVEFRWT